MATRSSAHPSSESSRFSQGRGVDRALTCWFAIAVGCAVFVNCSADRAPHAESASSPSPAPGLSVPAIAPPPPTTGAGEAPKVAAGEPAAEVAPPPVAELTPGVAPPPVLEPAPAVAPPPVLELAPTPEPVAEAASPPATEATPEPSVAPRLYVAAREVLVYAKPSFNSRKLGYLRAGASVTRSPQAQGFERCPKGFYRVAPEGFVCAGDAARLEPGDAVSELADVRPDRAAPLPYVYARSKQPPPPLYVKLPSAEELARVEPEAVGGRFRVRGGLDALPVSALPPLLAAGHALPTPFGHEYDRSLLSSGRALADSAFAITRVFERDRRRYALTTDPSLVPLDRLEPVVASRFHGLALTDADLPVAFVMQRGAYAYLAEAGRPLRPGRKLEYREALPLSGRMRSDAGVRWLETRTGEWVRDERLTRVDMPSELPDAARRGKSWIWVSIGKQALVAFQGKTPVYVTLVSTGVDGLGDPETTRSTIRGQFLIHTKHVSVTMGSDEAGAEFELKDIPYVQYFKDNYAIHAAFWHDGFGAPRSHGCINLAPLDARWLFHWSDPPVPALWHGAFSLHAGTLVDIEP